MTAEQQAPAAGPLGPVARYEQNVIDRITDSSTAWRPRPPGGSSRRNRSRTAASVSA